MAVASNHNGALKTHVKENKMTSVGKTTTIKINSTCETADAQYELEKHRLQKKREIRTYQYGNYCKMFYGSPSEKETLKSNHREALLKQCRDKEILRRQDLHGRVKESQNAVAMDQSFQEFDSKQLSSKSAYLKQFRDENKVLMEKRASDAKKLKAEENKRENDLLKYDPINWSKTLV